MSYSVYLSNKKIEYYYYYYNYPNDNNKFLYILEKNYAKEIWKDDYKNKIILKWICWCPDKYIGDNHIKMISQNKFPYGTKIIGFNDNLNTDDINEGYFTEKIFTKK